MPSYQILGDCLHHRSQQRSQRLRVSKVLIHPPYPLSFQSKPRDFCLLLFLARFFSKAHKVLIASLCRLGKEALIGRRALRAFTHLLRSAILTYSI